MESETSEYKRELTGGFEKEASRIFLFVILWLLFCVLLGKLCVSTRTWCPHFIFYG